MDPESGAGGADTAEDDCGKPARITYRGKSYCWNCFDARRRLPNGISVASGPLNIPKSIMDDPHWDGTWPTDGFNYQKAIDTHDDPVRADDDFVGGVC